MDRNHQRRRLPPLNALRAFEAAARHLNFSRAADELSVTPGAVSQQIQNLEDYVGAALFKRTPKGLLLTDAAQTALPALREAFDRLAEAASLLTAAVDGRRLTITAPPSFAAKWLVPRLGAFERAHPQVDVWLSAGMELVDLSAGEVDLAIRYGAGRYPGLEVKRIVSEMVLPVVSPELLHEIKLETPEDLANHTLLHDGSPEIDDSCPDWPMWLAARGLRGIDGHRGPRFNQSSLVIEAAANGRGVALAKRTLAQADLDAGRLVAPLQIETAVDFAYYLVHPKAKGRLPQVKAFIGWIEAEAQAHEDALRAIDNGRDLIAGLLLAAALAAPTPVETLNAALLSHDSATGVLQAVCARHAPAGTRIRARQVAAPEDPAQTSAARRDLGVAPSEPLRHRRVELLCGETVYSRADNWYLPGRLTPDMNTALETTQTPFGVVVGPLQFQRRTISATVLSRPGEVLQHRATLATPDGRPFSLVVETYTDAAVAP